MGCIFAETRMEVRKSDSERAPVKSEPLSTLFVVWDECPDRVPERVRVFLVSDMSQFVNDHVVLNPNWGEDKPPAQPDRSVFVLPPATGQWPTSIETSDSPSFDSYCGLRLGNSASARRRYQSITACRLRQILTPSPAASRRCTRRANSVPCDLRFD